MTLPTNSMPRASVIIPVHSGAHYIRKALGSILTQSEEGLEIIVVEDRCTDGAVDVAREAQDKRVRILRSRGPGLVSALNTGIDAATSEIIIRMDADDVSYPNRVSTLLGEFSADQSVGVVCSNARRIDHADNPIGYEIGPRIRKNLLLDGLLFSSQYKPIIHPTTAFRKSVWSEVGGYRDFSASEDHDFWLRALRVCDFKRVPQVLLDYRVHPGGTSVSRQREQLTSAMMAAASFMLSDIAPRIHVEPGSARFEEMRGEVASFVATLASPLAAFMNARDILRRQGLIRALPMILAGTMKHGPNFYPQQRRRLARREILRAVSARVRHG